MRVNIVSFCTVIKTLSAVNSHISSQSGNVEYFDRDSSLSLVFRSEERNRFEGEIYPIILNFHEDDVPLFENEEIVDFVKRAKTVVVEGRVRKSFLLKNELIFGFKFTELQPERLVIEAVKHSEAETQWSKTIYDVSDKQPESLEALLQSPTVTAVTSLFLRREEADVVIERTHSVTDGDLNWTITRTSDLRNVPVLRYSPPVILIDNEFVDLYTLKRKKNKKPRVKQTGVLDWDAKESLMNSLSISSGQIKAEELRVLGTTFEEILSNHKLKNLHTLILNIGNSARLDISVLAKLPNLEFLSVPSDDVSGLAQLHNVKYLHVRVTALVDVSKLAQLQNLKRLSFAYGLPVDNEYVARLKQLTNLESLDLHGKKLITNISPLGFLENLKTLNLSNTGVTDIIPLVSLMNLKSLNISGTQVTSINPLLWNENLESLDLSRTQVTNIYMLQYLSKLKTLNLSGSQVTDIAPLKQLENLESLDLSHLNNVEDICALKHLNKLRILDLKWTTTLETQLSCFPANLEILNLSETGLKALTGLKNLKKLESLDLYSLHKLKSISELEQLENLKYLNLSFSGVTSVSALSKLPKLEYLFLKGSGNLLDIKAADFETGFKKLKYLDLERATLAEDFEIAASTKKLPQSLDIKLKSRSEVDRAIL